MAETTRSIVHAPNYARHRSLVTTADPAVVITKEQGMNAQGYIAAHVQVIPSGGANPSVAIRYWSQELGQFVVPVPAVAVAGQGADTPYEFTFDCRSRIFLVAVTALAAGSVEIFVAGSELDHMR